MANRVLLEKQIKEYCKLNDINDVPGFITQCMLRGFNTFKYGTSPGDNIKRENGEIVDKGLNRESKKTKTTKKDEKNEDSVKETKPIEVKTITEEKQQPLDAVKAEPVLIKKKRKITVTNIN